MKEKEQENLKAWGLWCIALTVNDLLRQESYDTRNGCNHSADSGNDGTDVHEPGTTKLTLEATLVDYNPSFMGYVIAIMRLIKQAFFHKKGEHFVLIA